VTETSRREVVLGAGLGAVGLGMAGAVQGGREVSFTLRFPSGVMANCASSYSAHQHRSLRIVGETGWVQIDQAFDYDGRVLRVARLQGGREAVSELRLPHRNQFALELDHMAQCVKVGRAPRAGRGGVAGPPADGGDLRGGPNAAAGLPAGGPWPGRLSRATPAALRPG